jgi:hypothetical protein
MTPEQDKALCEKYPKIFRDRHSDMSKTAMCWGLDVGPGWYDLIDTLCSTIQGHIDQSKKNMEFYKKSYEELSWFKKLKYKVRIFQGKVFALEPVNQVVAFQVKEKFGGLRFYINSSDAFIYGAIDMAEKMSYRICEDCGRSGKSRNDRSWILTLCDECNAERNGPVTKS